MNWGTVGYRAKLIALVLILQLAAAAAACLVLTCVGPERQLAWGLAAGAVVLLAGLAGAVAAARWLIEPMRSLGAAARAIEQGEAPAADIAALALRPDPMGALARRFAAMADAVAAREGRLDELVREHTHQLEEKNRQLIEAHARIGRELDAGRAFQLAILPGDLVVEPTHQVFGFMVPAREIGGDFYDHFRLPDGRLAVAIGDVSDKGIPPALFMVLARTAIRTVMMQGHDPGETLAEVNKRLLQDNPLNLFVTVFCGIFDPSTGLLRYASGGHPPAILQRKNKAGACLPLTGGSLLGLLPNLKFAENEVQMEAGDILFLYTDGFTEAEADDEMFGEQGLIDGLAKCRHLSADNVAFWMLSTLNTFTHGVEQDDDVTCLALIAGEAVTEDRERPEPVP